MKHPLSTLFGLGLIVIGTAAPAAASAASCDEKCLIGIMDAYLTQMPRHDPAPLHYASSIIARENGEEINLGSGIWTQVTKIYPGQTYADATLGGVVHIGA